MKEKPTTCDGAGIGENPIVSQSAAEFFNKVLEFAIADGIDADDKRATTARLDEAKREWDNVRKRAAKFWPHFNEAEYLKPSGDTPLSAIELHGKVFTGKDEALLLESERIGNKLAIAYLYKKATFRLSECVDFQELKEKRENLSRKCSANGRKGAKAKKRNAPKDEETKRLKAELFMEMRKPSNLSERSMCANFARAHVLKVATVRSWWIEHKNEKRGRHNTNRDGESNS